MKSKWLNEIKELLDDQQFKDWWRDYTKTQIDLEREIEHHDELLMQDNLMDFRSDLSQKNAIDKLSLNSHYEDLAIVLMAEASTLENRSYESVASFENKRMHVSEIWFRKGAVEHRLEGIRSEIKRNSSSVNNGENDQNVSKINIKALESDLKKLEKEHIKLTEEYEKESQIKIKLWEEVEDVWIRSLELNLKVAESRIKAKRIKNEAQRYFSDAEDSKKRTVEIKKKVEFARDHILELKNKLEQLLETARRNFACIAQEDFLYWQQKENNRMVYCLPLITDMDNFNIELKALGIYQVDRQKGVNFIEPGVPINKAEYYEDKRLDSFFVVDLPKVED